MWYDWDYIVCHIREIGVLEVNFFMLALLVGDILYAERMSNVHVVRGVTFLNQMNLPQDVW
jgi:hypothetical protein